MKDVFLSFLLHRNLYLLSLSIGTAFSQTIDIFIESTPEHLFGINTTLWLVAFSINIIDICTGIRADIKRKKDANKPFSFESGKAWRAFEKIFIFTMIIWFIYSLEKESLRLQAYYLYSQTLLHIKFILVIYVVLIEIQSIGENEVVRFGKKSKVFQLLDKTIELLNEGILEKIKSLLGLR